MNVRITVVRKACYPDLVAKYENPLEHPCEMEEGQVFVADGSGRPDGLCSNAWATLEPFVQSLLRGEGNFYDGWMKNPLSALLSCNDGFRPVSYLIEAID